MSQPRLNETELKEIEHYLHANERRLDIVNRRYFERLIADCRGTSSSPSSDRWFKRMRVGQLIDMSKPHRVQNSDQLAPALGPFHDAFLLAERSDGVDFCVRICIYHQLSNCDNILPVTLETVSVAYQKALLRMEEYRTCDCAVGKNCELHRSVPNPVPFDYIHL